MNCTPTVPGDGESIGRNAFRDSADNPACSDRALNEGYVHPKALGAASFAGDGLAAPKPSTTLQMRMVCGPHQHGA